MLFSLHLLCRKWLNVWLLCCQFDGQTGRFSSLLLSLTEIFCKDSKVEKKPHLVPRVWMSGCWHESVCYTDADSLTSGGLRLLTDTKDTSTLAQPHAPSWMLSFFFFFLIGALLLSSGRKAVSGSQSTAPPARLGVLFPDTKDVQHRLVPPRQPHTVSLSSLCLLRVVLLLGVIEIVGSG